MSLFDPETGKVIDREALRQVQIQSAGRTVPKEKVNPDGTKSRQLINENTGQQSGYQTIHGSGRVDAVVTPETIRAGIK